MILNNVNHCAAALKQVIQSRAICILGQFKTWLRKDISDLMMTVLFQTRGRTRNPPDVQQFNEPIIILNLLAFELITVKLTAKTNTQNRVIFGNYPLIEGWVMSLVTASVFSLINPPLKTEADEGSCPQICILSSLISPNASAPASYFLGEPSTQNTTDVARGHEKNDTHTASRQGKKRREVYFLDLTYIDSGQ
ncbi:hypothetical protein DUI87_20426 [Hirundo rustica rustica]|uniref:Uncharacterized protein n=1 Tax=Hirundo rustica rustica TaxID=333673 RepID=A0A3M0JQD2_HIRRU|nr:hypothetical protein DUI87_20426 [Hirundo rustica rustica]